MKNVIQLASIGLMALAIAGVPTTIHAQETEAPAANQKAAKSDRAVPFNGKLKAIDKAAGTITVGNRTFHLTASTRYLQGSLDEATVGESVGGSYWKGEDGKLTVNSIRFGAKPKAEDKESGAAE
jgi:high-affinity K+ transport system ATPase subunit B